MNPAPSRLLASLQVLVLAAAGGTQDSPKKPPASAGPGPLRATSMTYDPARRAVLLFGGAGPAAGEAAVLHGDLWSWDGRAWQRLAADGPSPRTQPCFAFDVKRHQAVLRGGSAGAFPKEEFLDDTWEWDGKRWTKVADHGPGRRAHSACAWDPTRERVLLFGGMEMDQGRECGDIWQWGGKQWEPIDSKPPALTFAPNLFFDEAAQSMMLVCVDPKQTRMATSAWNGREFMPIGKGGPDVIPGAVVALGKKGGALCFGGWDGKALTDQAWRLSGESWTRVDGKGPGVRTGQSMAYDSARDRVVLYGGENGKSVFGDTWEFDGRSWQQVAK